MKYRGEEGEILLAKEKEKVNLKDWWNSQREYFLKAREGVKEKAKTWQKRHNNYLKFKNKKGEN